VVKCSKCSIFVCEHPEQAKSASKLDYCPMNIEKDVLAKATEEYEKLDVRELAHASALVESEGYMKWTRVEDTMEFARRMNTNNLYESKM
jgi:uncharacterized metal-binding protein